MIQKEYEKARKRKIHCSVKKKNKVLLSLFLGVNVTIQNTKEMSQNSLVGKVRG